MTSTQLNYAVEQRIRFIDFLLQMYGHIGRAELITYFGISAPQATRDFRLYKQLAPNNVIYKESDKRYSKSPQFKSIFTGEAKEVDG